MALWSSATRGGSASSGTTLVVNAWKQIRTGWRVPRTAFSGSWPATGSAARCSRTRGRRARHVSAAVTKPDVGRGESDTFPQFLPDGVHFLYLARSQGTPRVFVGSLDGRASRHVLDANARLSYADPGFLFLV